MVISLLSVGIVLLIAYLWMTRGFFSALIHFLSVIIAGAVAFGVWEPLAQFFLGMGSATGFIAGSAWALGLAIPFAVTLALTRFILDKIIRANVDVPGALNMAGGGLLGLASGVISAGVFVIASSNLRYDMLGNRSFASDPSGNVIREGGLWVPFDAMTVAFYSHLSETAFRTPQPMAQWRPTAHEIGNAARMSPFEGSGRNTFREGDFEVKARFTVGKGGSNFSSLLSDRWNTTPQSVTDPSGNPYPAGTHVEGYVVSFQAGSKEKDGQTAVGNAQVSLLLRNATGEHMMVFPFAVSASADPRTPGAARFRFDGADVFIASVGGASESLFAFEFPCPPGYEPVALFAKGIRVRVDSGPLAQARFTFSGPTDRDAGLGSLGLGDLAEVTQTTASSGSTTPAPSQGQQIAGLDTSAVVAVGDGRAYQEGRLPEGVSASLRLPWNLLIQKGQHGGLELNEDNNKNLIVGGEARIILKEMPTTLTEKPLKVENFPADATTVLVQVEVSPSSRTSILGGAITAAENILPPVLVDTQGEKYQPIGYVYTDETELRMKFEPGDPIRSMSQLPSLSRSRPAQRMVLLFRVSLGREVRFFAKGNKVIYEYNPPFKLNQRQENR
ncbi:MAG: CvpA family protein [Planctomycetota bacterium]|nr:CvpA family protein [Planctomycetota bacterium]